MGSSALLRCISKKVAAGNSLRCIIPGVFRMMSTVNSESPPIRITPPLVMVQSEKDDNVYNLHSLSQKAKSQVELRRGSVIVGASHGWIAIADERNLCLYNPVSGRRVNLPPIPQGLGSVVKMIVTNGEGEDCFRAVMILLSEGKSALAFCCPGSSREWSIIGQGWEYCYKDIVYSPTYKLLFCLKEEEFEVLEGWDLGDPHSPRLHCSVKGYLTPDTTDSDPDSESDHDHEPHFDSDSDSGYDSWKRELNLKVLNHYFSWKTGYLVASQEKEEIFIVHRYTNPWDGKTPITTGFLAWKIVLEGENKCKIFMMKDDLEGVAMFVGGVTDGVAVAGKWDGFPRRNSICFSQDKYAKDTSHGVFDYETISFQVSPHDGPISRRDFYPPMWITPSTC